MFPQPVRSLLREPNRKLSFSPVAFAVCMAFSAPIVCASGDPSNQVTQQKISYQVQAGPLNDVLINFAAVSGVKVSFESALFNGIRSNGLIGSYTVKQGFDILLAGTSYRADYTQNGYVLTREQDSVALPSVNVLADGLEQATGPVEGYIATRSSTATKIDVAVEDMVQSVAIVTADKMEMQGANRIGEALAYSSGINVAPWGGQQQWDWFYIRGFDAYNPGIYLDGLQMRNNGNWGMWQVDSYSLERIEVMKGPSSVMYGVNGPGGVINLVSKRPTTFAQREIVFELGNNQHKQLAADIAGPMDERGEWLYRATALVKDGELEGTPLPDQRYYFAPSLTWNPSDKTALTVYAQYYDIDSGADTHEVLVEGSLLPNPNGKTELPIFGGSEDYNMLKQQQWLLGYDIQHAFANDWTLVQKVRYAEFDFDFKTVYKSGWITINENDSSDKDNFRYIKLTGLGSEEEIESLNLDTYIIKGLTFNNVTHQVLMGIDYQKTDMRVEAYWGATFEPLDTLNRKDKLAFQEVPTNISGVYDITQTGIYLQDQITIGENWVVNLATRYDETKTQTYDLTGKFTEEQKSDGFSSRFGVIYKANNGVSPYVSYAESFAPTGTIDPAKLEPFPPEKGQQIEAGVRYTPRNGTGRYSVAAFDITRKDYTQWVWDEDPHPEQKGEVNVQGAEVEALVKPTDNSNVMASYTWIPKAEVVNSVFEEEIGKQSNAVSEHALSVWGDYTFNNGLQVGLGARYVGSNKGVEEKAPKRVPAYVMFDSTVKYDVEQWTFALNLRNLFDDYELTTCNNRKCYYTSGRQVTLSATYIW